MVCPGCNGRLKVNDRRTYICKRCNGIIATNIWLGDSYEYVLPQWSKDPNPTKIRYFDFSCLGSDGPVRRHGWYDPETRLIVQVG